MTTEPKARALGRGLDALFPNTAPKPAAPPPASPSAVHAEGTLLCPIERIQPQPDQPRRHFDETALNELAASIAKHGLLEPLVVRSLPGGRYELIAGERRWRASQRAGLKDVLVVVRSVNTKDAFELALVENVQREDLNSIELAEAYARLIQEYQYSQQTIGEAVGKDRVTIANILRLLKLPQSVRDLVRSGKLSEGHARALLGASTEKQMQQLADKAIATSMSVRALEALIRASHAKAKSPEATTARTSASIRDLEARLMRRLGTKVTVKDNKGKGALSVAYGSLDELDRILAILDA